MQVKSAVTEALCIEVPPTFLQEHNNLHRPVLEGAIHSPEPQVPVSFKVC